MLKNGELLFDFKERIKSKYGYDEEFAITISMMGEAIADYLGSEYESVVYQALESCKIVVAKSVFNGDKNHETILDVIDREGMNEHIEGGPLTEADLRRAGGVNHFVPRLSYDGTDFKIDRVDRIIVLPWNFDNDSIRSLKILAHEALHLVKAYLNGFSIEGDILTERAGVTTERYKLSFDGGQVKRTLIDTIGTGLDEGLNSYDEMCLMRESFDSNYSAEGYDYQRVTAGHLMDGLGLREMFIKAQITKADSELRRIFDEHMEAGYDGFLQILDKTEQLELERFASLFDSEKMKEVNSRLEEHFDAEIVPQVQMMNRSIRKDNVLEDGLRKSA